MALFYCDLNQYAPARMLETASSGLEAERKLSQQELDPSDLERIVNFWNPKAVRRNMRNRFQMGASLWLARSAGKLAGFGWSLTGVTVEPHYFPVGPNDVHLFDFLVFPEFRGRGINPYLVGQILKTMASEGRSRAYIEAAEWNHSQLTSLSKTGFQWMGNARKITVLGRTIVQWSGPKSSVRSTVDSAVSQPLNGRASLAPKDTVDARR
jgi:ribosomal protein S18 acetylase RimI-like enzyme